MDVEKNRLEAMAPGTEPGMNLISADFDLVMVNRTNERLYGKPIVALLGKKCYREFEKRDEPCPHCPGKLALETGEAHETETVGLRDDGTKFFARIRAHPVMGPHGRPTGFIEVVEDITEQKRAESLDSINAALRTALLGTHNMRKALRETFEAAMRVECIDMGCVFLVDQATGTRELAFGRNVPPACLPSLVELSRGESKTLPAQSAGAPRDIEIVSVLHGGEVVATLVLGTSAYPEIPATLRAGLQSLGAAAGYSISRIRAEQSRGDAVADLEALIAINPVATWLLDTEGRVTLWNRAAERLFGWRATEVIGRLCPVGPPAAQQDTGLPASTGPEVLTLSTKSGSRVEVRLATVPFRDVVGNASSIIAVAEDLSIPRRLAALERDLAGADGAREEDMPDKQAENGRAHTGHRALKVLIIDSTESWGRELADTLRRLDYAPEICESVSAAAPAIANAAAEGRPIDLAIVDLVAPRGSGALGQAAVLRELGFKAPVVASSDADVRGHQHHGIAAIIRYPYDDEAVDQVLLGVFAPHR